MLYPNLQSLEQFEQLQQLGGGYSAKVELYRHKESQQLVAIKLLQPIVNQQTLQEQYENEIAILEKFIGNKNVVQILGYGCFQTIDNSGRRPKTRQNYFIIMEYLQKGQLVLTQKSVRQLIEKIQMVHNKNVVHRDLNLNNILFRDGEPVLIDFGFACQSDGRHKLNEFYGTEPYTPPEILEGSPYYGQPADIYSLGVIIKQLDKSGEYLELVNQMTHENPYKRIGVQDILKYLEIHQN